MVIGALVVDLASGVAERVAALGFHRLSPQWDPRSGLTQALGSVAPKDRVKASRYISRLAEDVAHELDNLIAIEFRDLDDGEIQGAVHWVQTMLSGMDIGPDSLVVQRLDAGRLAESLWRQPDRFVSEAEQTLCARLLSATCRVIVECARRLDAVQGAALSALLNGQDDLAGQIAAVIDRVQDLEGLLKGQDDQGLARVLVPWPALCAERDAETDQLVGRLTADPGRLPALQVIRGWPGVGKTTLVTSMAHDRRLAERYGMILWVRAGQEATPASVIQQVALQLGVSEPLPATQAAALASLRAILQSRQVPVMIICDDLWDANLGGLLLSMQPATVVATTREPSIADALKTAPQDVYRLGVLDTESGVRLLSRFSPSAVNLFPEQSRQLVEDVEGLPLALRVAGRLLESEIAVGLGAESELFDELRQTGKFLQQSAPQDRYDHMTGSTPTVDLLFRYSTDRLDEVDRQRFAMLGVLAAKPALFAFTLLPAAWSTDRPATLATVRSLVGRGLVEAVPGMPMFQMHALLREHARSLLIPD